MSFPVSKWFIVSANGKYFHGKAEQKTFRVKTLIVEKSFIKRENFEV